MIANIKGIIIHLTRSKKYWIRTQIISILSQFLVTFVLAYSLECFYEGLAIKKHIWLFLIIYLVISYIFKVIMNYVDQYFMMNSQTMIKNDLYTEMLKGINKSEKYILDSSKVFSEISQNVEIVSDIIGRSVTYFVSSMALLILFLIIIFYTDFIYGIAYLFVFLSSTALHILFYSKMSEYKSEVQKRVGISSSFLTQSLSGISEIIIYGMKEKVIEDNRQLVANIRSTQMKYEKLYMWHEMCNNLLYYISEIMPILLGIIFLLFHPISIGKIMFLVQFTQYLSIYMMDFSESYCQIKSSQSIIDEVNEQLNCTRGEREYVSDISDNSEYVLELENLRIQYDEKVVIDNMNLKCKPGEIIALVGESGAGKSSIFNAIMQFVDYKGSCMLYGTDVKAFSKKSVRKHISYMDQNNCLIDISIYDNIHLGNLNASKEDVIEASKIANAYQFVENLPDGFDSVIGNEGINLSGGEIQRVCLARTILKKSTLLLLDEPTSSLDIMNENHVIHNILKKNQSCILLATHRINILRSVDRIIVLQSGKIVAEGTFDNLMHNENSFKSIFGVKEFVNDVITLDC